MSEYEVRFAKPQDVPEILGLIRELAEFENLLDRVTATEELLSQWLFERKTARVLLARAAGEAVGYALFFESFSTFLGKGGLYLEDLYVRPAHRGRGLGRELLRRLAGLACEQGYGRLEWACLDWNRPSIDFYLSLGARPVEGWTVYRLEGETLWDMAEGRAP